MNNNFVDKKQCLSFGFLDAIASPSSYPCQWVGQRVIVSGVMLSMSLVSKIAFVVISAFSGTNFAPTLLATNLTTSNF